MYECLSEVVKIAKTESDCISGEYCGTSLSGFYLEDTTRGRIPINAAFYGDAGRMADIIPDSINEVMGAIRDRIDSKLRRNYQNLLIKIGFPETSNGTLTSSGKFYNFLCLKANNIRGAIFTITKINIHLATGFYMGEVSIIQNDVDLYTGTGTDLSLTPITVNLNKPVFILYEADPLNLPKNFKHTGCCGKTPIYHPYMKVGSGAANADETLVYTVSEYTNGFEIDGFFDCDGFSFLCDGDNVTIDFQRNNFGRLLAKLIQQVARRNIGTHILTDDNLSSYKLVNDEQLGIIMEYLNQDIEKMLNFVHQTYDMSDCYLCDGIYKQSIII